MSFSNRLLSTEQNTNLFSEGTSVEERWIWNNTIGPVEDRPGRQGAWGYPNTDALGLIEYLLWCQDMSLTPLLAVWDGLTIGGGTVSGDALKPYVQDALNELEVCVNLACIS